jgi:hypothetical protein
MDNPFLANVKFVCCVGIIERMTAHRGSDQPDLATKSQASTVSLSRTTVNASGPRWPRLLFRNCGSTYLANDFELSRPT